MSAKEKLYAALPPDEQVARAYREGRLGGVVCGALERAGLEFGEASTALVHYLLSVLGVPSQRKVASGGVELDVVVPDLNTLLRSPESALVVCIPDSPAQAGELARGASGAQPDPGLVWMVCESAVPGHRTFDAGSLAELPRAAEDFLGRAGSGRLRVLGSRH